MSITTSWVRAVLTTTRVWLAAVLLGFLGAGMALTQIAYAQCPPDSESDFCSATHGLIGNLSPLSGRSAKPNADNPSIADSILPTAGQLTYVDMKKIEADARALLIKSRNFRVSISPHLDKPDFDELVAHFDYDSGFDRTLPDDPDGLTIQQRIDKTDADLRQARDFYAFLAVYADEARFRADNTVDCGAAADDLVGTAPDYTPTFDYCNFANRMRESVREAAYLRMIFGQQFTADALGINFSGQLIGGEAFVRREVDQLQMAAEQYEGALLFVKDGMRRAIGSGCYISDFYQQPEWSLLSRAVDGRERALHFVATRKSYLDDYGTSDAQLDFRQASIEQYVNMVGTAGLASRPLSALCARGTDPDSAILSEMALRMIETREASHELAQGRNIFGFDVSFTPARPYRTSFGSNDTGMLNEAKEAANRALELQGSQELADRTFDQKQDALMDAIFDLKKGRDEAIQAEVGCDRTAIPSDEAYFACINDAIEHVENCDPLTEDSAAFEACIQSSPEPVSTMTQTRQEQRAVYLGIRRIQTQMDNIYQRINSEQLRSVKVKGALFGNAQAQAGFALADAIANCCTLDVGAEIGGSINLGAPISGALQSGATMRQNAADMEVEDAELENIVRNLVLDLAELQVDLEIAIAEYNAKATEFRGVVGQTRHDAIEAQRERAYLENSNPANDPSYRLIRDSKRIEFAEQMEYAARIAYLAARRAEYEYAARLNANNVRISDVYRARTADDLLAFLTSLESTTNNLVVEDAEINQEDFTMSVALHVLGLTDDALGLNGAAAQAERTKQFRDWVAENTQTGSDGKPVLSFTFSTSLVDNGIFSSVIQQGFDRFWLFKMAGIGQPKAASTGFGINLLSEQPVDLQYRRVVVTQAGDTHLRSRAGCIFEYKLIQPASMLNLDWPSGQDEAAATTDFKASVNGASGERTAAFLGRPVSAAEWRIEVRAGAPETGLPSMDLQQLTDIQFQFSTTRASRSPGDPVPSECVRGDF